MITPHWKTRRRRLGSYPKPWNKMTNDKYHKHPYLSSSQLKTFLGVCDSSDGSAAMYEGTLVHECIEDYLLTGRLKTNRLNGLSPAKKNRCLNCVNQAIAYIGDKSYEIVEGSLFASVGQVRDYGNPLLTELMDMTGAEGM